MDVTFANGYLACSFIHKDKPYGQKMKVRSRKVMDVTNVAFLLLTNAIETYENLSQSTGGTTEERPEDNSGAE